MTIHLGLPNDQYQQRTPHRARKSALDQIHRSPAHYRAWLEAPDVDSDAYRLGRGLHCAALEPERYRRDYVVLPEFGDLRTKAAKAAKAEWLADHEGQAWLPAADAEAAERMVAALHAHPLAAPLLRGGHPEVTALWEDADTGLQCCARADYWIPSRRVLVDLKTTRDASPRAFARAIGQYRYHVQDAHYRAGWEACGERADHFIFIAIEKTPPYGISVHQLDPDSLLRAEDSRRGDLRRLADCVRDNDWPCYDARIHTTQAPQWAD